MASSTCKNKESEWFQILAIFTACLSSLSGGMHFSWPSPSIPRITADNATYTISPDQASLFPVLPPIGVICSCLVVAKLVDWIGRKYTVLLMGIPYLIAWLLIATTTSVYLFYVARFVTGFGDACLFAALPVYVGEVCTPKVRGSWGNLVTLNIYLGQLTITVIGNFLTVSRTAWVSLLAPVALLVSMPFMPETPYYYLMKGRVDDARKSLRRLRRSEEVEKELFKIKHDVERQMSESGTWSDLFCIASNRKALLSGIFLRASQQLGGCSAFAVYNQYIFLKAGGNLTASTSSIIFFSLTAVLNLCAAFTLDRLGRRRSYFGSLLACGLVLLGESLYFFLDQFHPELNVNRWNWVPVAGMILFVIFYSFGLGIAPTLMLGELFSTSVKGKGLCVLNIVFACLVGSVTQLFYVLESNFGLYCPFFFFAVSCLLSTWLAVYLVPETKGKTLEEIQQSLRSENGAGDIK